MRRYALTGFQLSVTLRQGLKSHGFFCLSSVREQRSNAAWLRFGAARSGGKARGQRIHACIRLLGGARPVTDSMSYAKGSKAHNVRLASWEPATPASFDAAPLGTCPRGGGFSWLLVIRAATLPKAVDWIPVPSQQQIAGTVVQHGRVFTGSPSLPNPYTLQLFKLLEQVYYILHEMSSGVACRATLVPLGGLKPMRNPPHHCHSNGVACGGAGSVLSRRVHEE
jgi:hypothetical protein